MAIRAWALRDPLVRSFQQRIDYQRVEFLNEMFSHITDDIKKTETISLIRYCFYIGAQQIIPSMEIGKYKEILNILMTMFNNYTKQKK